MAISLLQSVSKNPGSVNTTTLALPGAVTPGSMIAVHVMQSNAPASQATFTFSDNFNGTYGAADVSGHHGTSSLQDAIFTFPNNSGSGTLTLTYLSTLSAQTRLVLEEWAGLSTTPIDQTATNFGGSGTSMTSGNTGGTGVASELVLGHFSTNTGSQTFTPGAGFTTDLIVGTSKLCTEYQIVSSTGVQNATGTLSAGDFWVALCATYKVAGAGGFPLVAQSCF